eukprot:CAMPEP_0197529354 /NCGR_PEP_ID=MMETSP1318-20131121/28142_1 /TAXON_ID=552666 /ORGANISM="Partenskyella glossopodia, Strain RCC365" /LENGTH=138 /DNA_ID=CAMNT_0043084787 /DNA_START=374 /DNA_END=790 /DNA_ORIENTATION=+
MRHYNPTPAIRENSAQSKGDVKSPGDYLYSSVYGPMSIGPIVSVDENSNGKIIRLPTPPKPREPSSASRSNHSFSSYRGTIAEGRISGSKASKASLSTSRFPPSRQNSRPTSLTNKGKYSFSKQTTNRNSSVREIESS